MMLVASPHTTKHPSVGLVFIAQSTETEWEHIQCHRVSLHLNCVGELAFS